MAAPKWSCLDLKVYPEMSFQQANQGTAISLLGNSNVTADAVPFFALQLPPNCYTPWLQPKRNLASSDGIPST